MLKLADEIRLKHDQSSGNYYLFCIQTGRHFRLNEVSYEIVKLLGEGKTKHEIVEWIVSNFETDISTCENDFDELKAFLESHKLIHTKQQWRNLKKW